MTDYECGTSIDCAWGCPPCPQPMPLGRATPRGDTNPVRIQVDEHGGDYEHDLLGLLEQKESLD